MSTDDSYEVPFSSDSDSTESNRIADTQLDSEDQSSLEQDAELASLAEPFVGRWNALISTTNWEKGKIIFDWREALVESGAAATEYSDEAWARRVGGVTAPHVGRLRRVFERFGSTFESYNGLYWSHFLAALDWDDAPLWLEGATQESWSVAGMREQRWQAKGAVESQRPTNSQIIEVDTDEDVTVMPAQGGGRTKNYGDEPEIASGPRAEAPDFGDEEELQRVAGAEPATAGSSSSISNETPVQPFANLPELPDDLADAVESLKLSLLRHKTAGWESVDLETVQRYLDAIGIMIRS